jgi:hypothetical protein
LGWQHSFHSAMSLVSVAGDQRWSRLCDPSLRVTLL